MMLTIDGKLVLHLTYVILLCGAQLGCGAHYKQGKDSFCRGLDPIGPHYKQASWVEICDWMTSSIACARGDGGYESFACKQGERETVDAFVSIVPRFGGDTVFSAEGLTLRCENHADSVLEVNGVPRYCCGIEMNGPFDLSSVTMADSVKYFSFDNGHFAFPRESGTDYTAMLPYFRPSSDLQFMSISCGVEKDDGFRPGVSVPVLDMSRYANLDQLAEVDIWVDGLVLNLEALVGSASFKCLSVVEGFRSASPEVGFDYANGDSEYEQEFAVDDSSFDAFVKRDFRGVGYLEVQISLRQMRSWDISALAGQPMDVVHIKSKNCLITGLDAFRKIRNTNCLAISMDIGEPIEQQTREGAFVTSIKGKHVATARPNGRDDNLAWNKSTVEAPWTR